MADQVFLFKTLPLVTVDQVVLAHASLCIYRIARYRQITDGKFRQSGKTGLLTEPKFYRIDVVYDLVDKQFVCRNFSLNFSSSGSALWNSIVEVVK